MAFDQSFYNQGSILSINIMVVDDDPIFLQIMSRRLEKTTFSDVSDPSLMEITVVAAKNSMDALSTLKVQRNNIDLIVTDYYMPGMNGLQLKSEITREYGNLPVIVISADANRAQESLTCGALCFIPKPIKPLDLTNIYQFALTYKRNGKSTAWTGHNYNNTALVSVPQQIQILPEQVNVSDSRSLTSTNESVVRIDGLRKTQKRRTNVGSSGERNVEPLPQHSKKRKIKWTDFLHDRFLQAIRHIGLDKAVPKKILEYMNVPGLTRENVASHLQKYRIFLRKVAEQGSIHSSTLSERDIELIYPNTHITELYYNYFKNSSSWFDTTTLNDRSSLYSKPRHGFGQSRLLSNTHEPLRSSQMPYINRSSTYQPGYTGSNVTLPIKSNLDITNQSTQNEGKRIFVEPSVVENNINEASQVIEFGQHVSSSVGGNNFNNTTMSGFASSTFNQQGWTDYGSSTHNQQGVLDSYGSLTPNQLGVNIYESSTINQQGVSNYGSSTLNQLGVNIYESSTLNQQGLSNNGCPTPNQLGVNIYESSTLNQPRLDSYGSSTPNQLGVNIHESSTLTRQGLGNNGSSTHDQLGVNIYGSSSYLNQPGLGNNGSSNHDQLGVSIYGSSTLNEPGLGNNGSLTHDQLGVNIYGSSALNQPGLGNNGSSTHDQLGVNIYGSSTINQPGLGNNGSLTHHDQLRVNNFGGLTSYQVGVNNYGSSTPKPSTLSSYRSSPPNQSGFNNYGYSSLNQLGLNNYGSSSLNQSELSNYGTLAPNQQEQVSSYESLTPYLLETLNTEENLVPNQLGSSHFSYGNDPYMPQENANAIVQPSSEVPQLEDFSIYGDFGMVDEFSCNISNFQFDQVNELPCDISNFQVNNNELQGEATSIAEFELPANFSTELNQMFSFENDSDWTFANTNQDHFVGEPSNTFAAPETNPTIFNMNTNHNQEQNAQEFTDDWSFLDQQDLVDEDFMNSLFNNDVN